MQTSETIYERRKKLQATMNRERAIFKFFCIIVIIILLSLFPVTVYLLHLVRVGKFIP